VVDSPKFWRDRDIMTTAGMVKHDWDETPPKFRPEMIAVDAIGLGAGAADRLREMGLPARDVNVGESAASDEKFVRLRDELWWRGREWFWERQCHLKAGIENLDLLVGELASAKYTYTSSGKIKVESKDEMKKRGVMSPDVADAFLTTFAFGDMRAHRFAPIDYNKYFPQGAFA
jgi:hypothetical protein